ncbi:MAG: phosphoglucosamine mutase [Pseudomonadota bacterium]
MTRKYFGTDGIRGTVGTPPMTPDGLTRFASAVSAWLSQTPPSSRRPLVLIGGDTRSSTPWILDVLAGTLAGHGIDVCPLGTASTPQLAFETANSSASAGIMVTASHNPARDNGVKLFGADGFKLTNEDEARIEALMDAPASTSAAADAVGTIAADVVSPSYLNHLKALKGIDLTGLKLVVDAAHGAAFESVQSVFSAFGAEAVFIGVEPDGLNINDGVGATHTEALSRKVLDVGAFAGIALDGDADRLIMVDETGKMVDGDQLLALLARARHAEGLLQSQGVAATVMSNLGLERYLAGLGVTLVRTSVGDRHVVEAMRAGGHTLGGEQSGHIVMLDGGTTGDGLLAALKVLSIAARDGRAFSQITQVFEPVPQKLVNVRFKDRNPLESTDVAETISRVTEQLGADGRVLVRKSGTEPLIRIMVEAVDDAQLDTALADIETAVRAAI